LVLDSILKIDWGNGSIDTITGLGDVEITKTSNYLTSGYLHYKDLWYVSDVTLFTVNNDTLSAILLNLIINWIDCF